MFDGGLTAYHNYHQQKHFLQGKNTKEFNLLQLREVQKLFIKTTYKI